MPGDERNGKAAGRPMGFGTLLRAVLVLGVDLVILAACMFLPAGVGWRKGWLFLTVLTALTMAAVGYLWRTHPETFVARSKIRAGTKAWDKVMLTLLLVSAVIVFPVAGLDARYHWSCVPLWVTGIGYVVFTFGFATFVWVLGENQFAEPTVRIQTERGHHVIDTGPYAFIRHPLYLAGLFLWGGVPLALGSFWALIPVAVAALVTVVRTVLEDRTLHEELAGYREYAARVRSRLIPWVW
jgi:protein-S-isoprenylcysteine O-methyltransferase Ste14